MFSSNFQFFVGNKQKKKNTVIGGLFSLLVIAVSLIYFIFLMNLYFNNKIQPTMTSSVEINS